MNNIPVVYTCPLGHTCERVVDGHIERCRWYTEIRGYNANTGVDENKWDCAIALSPLMHLEQAYHTRQNSACLESFRNEVVGAADRRIEADMRLIDAKDKTQ